jgi:hypothetical protein
MVARARAHLRLIVSEPPQRRTVVTDGDRVSAIEHLSPARLGWRRLSQRRGLVPLAGAVFLAASLALVLLLR